MRHAALTTHIALNPDLDAEEDVYPIPLSAIPDLTPPSGYWYAVHGVKSMRVLFPEASKSLSKGFRICPVDVLMASNYVPSDRLGLDSEPPNLKGATIVSLLRMRDDLGQHVAARWEKALAGEGLVMEAGFPKKPTKYPEIGGKILDLPEFQHINCLIMQYIYAGKQISLALIRKQAQTFCVPSLSVKGKIEAFGPQIDVR